MVNFIIRLLVNAVALVIVANFLPGVHVAGWTAAIIAAFVLGIVNAIIRPILIVLTLPVVILTLGLFTFVINAITFWLVAHLVPGFRVDNFWSALLGALVLSIVSYLLSSILKVADEPAKK
jgi:putative membrane protein